MYLNPLGSLNSGDFGLGGYAGGFNPGFGGGSSLLGYMPGAYGLQDPKRVMDYYRKQNELGYELSNMTISNSERNRRLQESVVSRRSTEQTATVDQANNLASTITRGRASQVIPQFERFVTLLGDLPMYAHLKSENPAQLRSLAKEQFQRLYQTSIENAVQENLAGSLLTGFKTGASLGMYNKPSSSTIIDKLTGTEADKLEKLEETVGATFGGAAAAGTIGAVAGVALKSPKLALVAGVLGGAWGLLTGIKNWATA